MNFVAALIGDRQRSSELPSLRKFEAGGVVDIVRLPTLGVEQHLVPANDGHLVGGGGTGRKSGFERCRRKKVEFSVNVGHAGRHFYADGEAVEQVAPPL